MAERWLKCANPSESTYEILTIDGHEAIRFYPCYVTSHNRGDIERGYCAYCEKFIPRAKGEPS